MSSRVGVGVDSSSKVGQTQSATPTPQLDDICEKLIVNGPRKGQSAKGTQAGWQRHRKAGEQPCKECSAWRNAWQRSQRRRPSTLVPRPGPLPQGLPAVLPRTEPAFVGYTTAICSICGRRGKANSKLLGSKATYTRIEACGDCK